MSAKKSTPTHEKYFFVKLEKDEGKRGIRVSVDGREMFVPNTDAGAVSLEDGKSISMDGVGREDPRYDGKMAISYLAPAEIEGGEIRACRQTDPETGYDEGVNLWTTSLEQLRIGWLVPRNPQS